MQSIKTLIEKTIEYNKPLVLLFIDFHKAFDTIELKAILDALNDCRVDFRYSRLIYNIYKNATMSVRLHEASNHIQIGKGVRKGALYLQKYLSTFSNVPLKSLTGIQGE